MSGGHYDYWQNHIEYIVEKLTDDIQYSGKPIPEELWSSWTRDHPEEQVRYAYPEKILRRFEEAIYALKRAYIYAQRADWLLSYDDGEEEFESRLTEELEALDKESKVGENGVRYIPVDRSVNPYTKYD